MQQGCQIKVLSDSEIEQIHRSALSILWRTGVEVREDQAFDVLKKAGCPTNGKRIRIPTSLVEKMLRQVPKEFMLYGRDPNFRVTLGGMKVNYEPMIGRLNILDIETSKRRRTTLNDVEQLIRLADTLEHYTLLHSGAIMPHIEGIPDQVAHARGYFASMKNSSKVIKGVVRGKEKARDCIRMASVIAGGDEALKKRPNIFTTCNVISPLEYMVEQTEGLIEYAKMGLPVDIASEPQCGATSPVTLAGTLAQQTAEILGMVVIAQLVNPGTPVLMGTVGAAMDLKNGTIALGGVEAALINVAHAQIAQFYQIPSRGTGSNTESKLLDMQAGYEKTITLLLPALAGMNMIFYPGTMDHALTVSLESLLIDHEICGMIDRILKGISVTEEKLALDIIDKVGPGGHFLNQKHTMKYLKEEHFLPKLTDRDSHELWIEKGERAIHERAREEVKRILAEHQPLPLDSAVEKELLLIIKEVEKREPGRSSGQG
jgi:trimethylamine--corrinoid protein Co-methyltransferase